MSTLREIDSRLFATIIIDEYLGTEFATMASRVRSYDATADFMLHNLFRFYRKDVFELLDSVIDYVISSPNMGESDTDLISYITEHFHKAFRQTDVIDSIRKKENDDIICIDAMIWNALSSRNQYFFTMVRDVLENHEYYLAYYKRKLKRANDEVV